MVNVTFSSSGNRASLSSMLRAVSASSSASSESSEALSELSELLVLSELLLELLLELSELLEPQAASRPQSMVTASSMHRSFFSLEVMARIPFISVLRTAGRHFSTEYSPHGRPGLS